MKTFFAVGILIVCCAACKKDETSQPGQQTPYEQWQSHNLRNYTVEQIRSCFCPGGGDHVRMTVRADTIARLVLVSDSSVVTRPYYRTIDSLFAIIRNSKGDSLVVRYNVQYGYPEYLDVNPQLHPVDGGYLYETSNLQIQ